jgi:CDP-diacylglycerol---serine O-phosphatidyltransferase
MPDSDPRHDLPPDPLSEVRSRHLEARRRDAKLSPILTRARPGSLPFLHLLPNLVTILGLCAGLTAIRFAFDARFEVAALLIIFAAVIDGLDGLLARKLKAQSSFGAELDSLSDFLCFGVAPALVVFFFALSDAPGFGWIFALIFSICCCLRLARFNVNRDVPTPPGRAHFTGVPAPAGALLAMLPLYLTLEGVLNAAAVPLLVALYLGAVGCLMVSRIPTLSPKGVRISRDHVPFVLVATAGAVGIMFTRFWLLMVLLVAAYIFAVGYGLATSRRRPTL